MLPTAVGNELLASLAAFGACGFHTERWASSYRANQALVRPAGRDSPTFVSPLSTDPARLQAVGRRAGRRAGPGPDRGEDRRIRTGR